MTFNCAPSSSSFGFGSKIASFGFGSKLASFNKIGSFSQTLGENTSWGSSTNTTTTTTTKTDFTLSARNDTWVDRAGVAEKVDGGAGIDTVVLKTDSSLFVSVSAQDGYNALIVKGEVVMYTKNVERIQMNNLTLVKNPVTGQCEVETPSGTLSQSNDAVTQHMINIGNQLFGYKGGACGGIGGNIGSGAGSNGSGIGGGCGSALGNLGTHGGCGSSLSASHINADDCGTLGGSSHGFGSVGFGGSCAPVLEHHIGC